MVKNLELTYSYIDLDSQRQIKTRMFLNYTKLDEFIDFARETYIDFKIEDFKDNNLLSRINLI